MTTGRKVEFTTIGGSFAFDEQYPAALIFDIHCDGTWKWSGISPVDIERLIFNNHEEGEPERFVDGFATTSIYPLSTKSLGDAMDMHCALENGYRANKYLLSTDDDDSRTWRFSVSLVSGNCAETLVASHEIVPSGGGRESLMASCTDSK